MEEYKRKPNIKCFICKSPIYRRPINIKNSKKGNAFCSMKCYGISCRKENPCIVCGKLILAGLHKKTCCRSCSNINRAGTKYKIGSSKSKVKSQQALKIRLINERGEKCNYEKYQILEVHHKDRSRENNNLENLLLICPNCHAEEHLLEKSWLNKKFD